MCENGVCSITSKHVFHTAIRVCGIRTCVDRKSGFYEAKSALQGNALQFSSIITKNHGNFLQQVTCLVWSVREGENESVFISVRERERGREKRRGERERGGRKEEGEREKKRERGEIDSYREKDIESDGERDR